MLTVRFTHDFPQAALDIAFQAEAGVTALFGPSGAGKSSVAKAVSGLMRPARGYIALNGRVLFDAGEGVNLRPQARRIGHVFQEGRLFPHLDVAANLRFGARFAPGAAPPGQEAQIVALLGLEPLLSRRPATLSGGEQQRVALGRALLMRPEALILDEPLAALDAPRKEEVLPYLERLRDEARMPILYISHAMDEVARLADRLVLMRDGRVLRAGPVFEVLSDPEAVPLIGVRAAGAVLRARVIAHHPDGLSTLSCGAGELVLAGITAPVGAALRVRILAQDVILSRRRPEGLSSRTILPVTVREVRRGSGPGAMVALSAGDERLLARLTARAVDALQLAPGVSGYAILKASAVARADIGSGEGA